MIAGENLKNTQKLYKPSENGARRRTDKIGGTRLFWTALASRISPARHNMEFLFTSGGRTQKYKLRAGET